MSRHNTPKPCKDCGAERPDALPRSIYCASCLNRRLLERGRKTAEKRRRQNGILPCKGTEASCENCNSIYVRLIKHSKYCTDCRAKVAKERVYKKRRDSGVEKMGVIVSCSICFSEIVKTNWKTKYCKTCAKIQETKLKPEQSEKYRATHGVSPSGMHYKRRSNEERALINRTKRESQKKKNKEAFSINERMSAGIRQSLRKVGSDKRRRRWEELVGYTADELREHLENQFLPGMTWQNMGEWHIDHIQPLATFDFSSADDYAFKKAWSLKNLRPLWAELNLAKGARTGIDAIRVFKLRGFDPTHAYPADEKEAAA